MYNRTLASAYTVVRPKVRISTLLAISSAMTLSGCVAYGPLREDASSRGTGYSEEQLSATTYLIRYDGRRDQTHEELRPLLVRRAGELCPGSFSLNDYAHESGVVIHSEKGIWPYVTARIDCGSLPIDRAY